MICRLTMSCLEPMLIKLVNASLATRIATEVSYLLRSAHLHTLVMTNETLLYYSRSFCQQYGLTAKCPKCMAFARIVLDNCADMF